MTTTSRNRFAPPQRRLPGDRGNILIYVLMTMVIFAVIGVTMVSLFSTSVSSSAVANETRRAFYLSESGIRYAVSELRQNGFSQTNINNLNTTNYKMPPSGGFDIRVFGAWFRSPSNQNVASGTITVELEKGKIPSGFNTKLGNVLSELYVVAYSLDPRSATQKPNVNEYAKVADYSVINDTTLDLILGDEFTIGRNKRICMAVRPYSDQTFTPSGDAAAYLDLKQKAAAIFPKTDGAFQFADKTYFYKSAKEESGYFRLSYITPGPNVSPTNTVPVAAATDFILLAPNNFFVTSKGTSSNNVEFGGNMDHAAALASHSAADLSEPDIGPVAVGDVAQIESGASFMGGGTDTQGDYLQIGPAAGMGAMWYNQNLYLGGSTNYCTSAPDINSRVGCFFESGVRAYFTLEYSGTGDGLVFALINGQLNQLASAGGDFEATELLGYAGDSRTNNSGGFLDTTGLKGLRPPKMGLELDSRRNWDASFEAKPTDFCSGSSLRQNTRNDPDPASATKDFVQYVYWGNTSDVFVPCRTTPSDRSSTYDDNRHNPGGGPAGDWSLSLTGLVNTSAAVSADGRTVYVASNNSDTNPTVGRLYAIDLDAEGYPLAGSGTPFFVGSNGVTSPVLDSSGNIYVGAGNALYALRPNRTLKFSYTLPNGTRASIPVIGPDGTIYVSAYDGVKFGYLYAINPNTGSPRTDWGTNPQPIQFYSAPPVLTPDGSLVIAAADTQRVYALRTSDGLPDANWGLNGAPIGGVPKNAPAVGPGATAKGTVYIGAGDRRVYALSGLDGSTLLTSPVFASEGLATQPVVAGGTLYVGSYDDNLYALETSNLSLRWSYYAAGNVQSSPAVDSNGTVYFGSDLRNPFVDNRNVNALYSDGTVKWQYSTGSGDVRGTPLVRPDGTVYIGSFNFNFYAINQFAVPKSLKDKFITYETGAVGGVPVSVDNAEDWLKSSTSKGPWAVRMEIYRSASPNASAPVGYYSYLLRTWVRQCQQASCSDVTGTFYDNTRLSYSPALRPPQMEQTINLSSTENTQFQRFIAGFTSQTASGDNQSALIRNLKLNFVRLSDPTVTCDPDWPASTACP
jgi:outer membrane protein assembly factor BamB